MTVLAGNWTNRLKMIPSLSGASIHVVFEERTVMPIAHRASPEAVSAVSAVTVAVPTLRPVTMPRALTETVCGEEERNVTPSGLPSMSYAVSFASPSWRMRSVGR